MYSTDPYRITLPGENAADDEAKAPPGSARTANELAARVADAEDYLALRAAGTRACDHEATPLDAADDFAGHVRAAVAAAMRASGADMPPEAAADAERAAALAAHVVAAHLASAAHPDAAEAAARAAGELVRHRLGVAAGYLKLLGAGRDRLKNSLAWAETEEVRRRLDECEDWMPLGEHDWRRVRMLILPERGGPEAWAERNRVAEALSCWGRVCETVWPEAYKSPPADEAGGVGETVTPGTPQKIAAMAGRHARQRSLFHDDDPPDLPESLALLAPQSLADEAAGRRGNGRKRASRIGGEVARPKLVPADYEGRKAGRERKAGQLPLRLDWRDAFDGPDEMLPGDGE